MFICEIYFCAQYMLCWSQRPYHNVDNCRWMCWQNEWTRHGCEQGSWTCGRSTVNICIRHNQHSGGSSQNLQGLIFHVVLKTENMVRVLFLLVAMESLFVSQVCAPGAEWHGAEFTRVGECVGEVFALHMISHIKHQFLFMLTQGARVTPVSISQHILNEIFRSSQTTCNDSSCRKCSSNLYFSIS